MSMGPLQILIILAIVLLFFGPKRLPGLAKSLGESIRGFKKALDNDDDSRDVTNSVANQKLEESDETKKSTEKKKEESHS